MAELKGRMKPSEAALTARPEAHPSSPAPTRTPMGTSTPLGWWSSENTTASSTLTARPLSSSGLTQVYVRKPATQRPILTPGVQELGGLRHSQSPDSPAQQETKHQVEYHSSDVDSMMTPKPLTARQARATSTASTPPNTSRSRGPATARLARQLLSSQSELPTALAELQKSSWRPKEWLSEYDKATNADGPKAALPFLLSVYTSTEQAIAQRGYELPPKEPAKWRGVSRGQYVDLSGLMQGHPQIEWYSRRTAPKQTRLAGHAPQVLFCQESPLDVISDFCRKDVQHHPVVLVVELNRFDDVGSPDLRGSNSVHPSDLLIRTDFARFIEASTQESQRCSGWSLKEHLGNHIDPYVLWCRQVTIFRGPREKGYPFMEKPVQITVLATSMASQIPGIQVVNFRRRGKTEWFEDNTEHSALLERLALIGRLAGAQEVVGDGGEVQKPLLVMCAIGSGCNDRQPIDALANGLKHWRKQFGSMFLRVCVCCRGRGGADQTLEDHLSGLVNKHDGSEMGSRDFSKNGGLPTADWLLHKDSALELAEDANASTLSGAVHRTADELLRSDSRAEATDDSSSESGSGTDVDVDDVARERELEQKRVFDHENAIEKQNQHFIARTFGTLISVKSLKGRSNAANLLEAASEKLDVDSPPETPLRSKITKATDEFRCTSMTPGDSSFGESLRESPSPPGVPPTSSPHETPNGSRRGTAQSQPSQRGSTTDATRRSTPSALDPGNAGRSPSSRRGSLSSRRRSSIQMLASSMQARGGAFKEQSDSSYERSFMDHLAGGRGDLNMVVVRDAAARRRSSILGNTVRVERRGSIRVEVTDEQLRIRQETRERLRRPSVTAASKQADENSGHVFSPPGESPGPPRPVGIAGVSPPLASDRGAMAPPPPLPGSKTQEVLNTSAHLNFINKAFRDSVMATSHLSEAVSKDFQKKANERKQLETSIAHLADSLTRALEFRQKSEGTPTSRPSQREVRT